MNTELEKSEALVILFQDGESGDSIVFEQDANKFYFVDAAGTSEIKGPLTEMLELAVQHWDDFMEVMVAAHKKLKEKR